MTTTFNRKILRRWLIGIFGLIVLPLFVVPLYGQDQIRYARRLADYGYYELAAHQLDKLQDQSGVPEPVRSYVPVVRSYIRIRKAERQDDLVKRVKTIEKALDDLGSFIEEHKKHPRLAEARDTYAENLRKAGKLWITIVKRNKEKQEDALRSGKKHFQQALEHYDQIEASLEGFDRCLNKLNTIITHHELARLYEQTGKKRSRRSSLETVLSKADDFLWSSCASKHDTLKIRARTYTALSHLEMSQVYKSKGESQKAKDHSNNAETYFNSIRKLVEVLKGRSDLSRTQFSVINNLLLRAYRFWVEYLHESGNTEEALSKVEEILIQYKEIKNPFQREQNGRSGSRSGLRLIAEFKPGRALLLVGAKILHERGARQQALDIAKQFTGRDGEASVEAKQLVEEWSEALGPEPLTPEEVLEMVDKSLRDESYLRALSLIEKWRSKISSQTQEIEWEWKFLYRKASAYAELKRWYEAAVLYEHIHERYHDVLELPLKRENEENQTMVEKVLKNDQNDFQTLRNRVLRANYLAARSYGMLRQYSTFDEDTKKYKSLLSHLSQEHPDSEWANRTVLLYGRLFVNRGEYDKAIEKFDEPEKGTDVWEDGQKEKGLAYFWKGESLAKKGKTDSAKTAFLNGVKVFRSFLKYLESVEDVTEDQRSKAWTAIDSVALSYLRDSVGQPDQLLKFLNEDLLSRFDFSADQLARAYYHRMNAYLQKGEYELATEVGEKLYNQYPNAKITTVALVDLADYFSNLRKNASEEEKKKTYRSREVSFYYRWIVRKLTSGGASNKNVYAIAVKLRTHGISSDTEKSLKRAKKLIVTLQTKTYEGQSVDLTGEQISNLSLLKEKALIHTYLGEFDQASKIYEDLGVDEGNVNKLSVLNGRARLYMKKMEQAKQEANREKLETLAEDAKGFINKRILSPSKEEGAVWWRGWRTYLEVMLIAGEGQRASKLYGQLKKRKSEEGQTFGGNADLFAELLEKYPGKLNP